MKFLCCSFWFVLTNSPEFTVSYFISVSYLFLWDGLLENILNLLKLKTMIAFAFRRSAVDCMVDAATTREAFMVMIKMLLLLLSSSFNRMWNNIEMNIHNSCAWAYSMRTKNMISLFSCIQNDADDDVWFVIASLLTRFSCYRYASLEKLDECAVVRFLCSVKMLPGILNT